jgi:hypothetical protein
LPTESETKEILKNLYLWKNLFKLPKVQNWLSLNLAPIFGVPVEGVKTSRFVIVRIKEQDLFSMAFKIEERKEAWLCMCKQSKNKPFCDGTHKTL